MRDAGLPGCFTEHPDFAIMAFNKTLLQTHRVTFDRTDQKAYVNSLPEHKRNHFVTYSTIIRWVYKRLGSGIREPLPVCVVQSIRDGHPDPEGNYTGYREADESEVEDHAEHEEQI